MWCLLKFVQNAFKIVSNYVLSDKKVLTAEFDCAQKKKYGAQIKTNARFWWLFCYLLKNAGTQTFICYKIMREEIASLF